MPPSPAKASSKKGTAPTAKTPASNTTSSKAKQKSSTPKNPNSWTTVTIQSRTNSEFKPRRSLVCIYSLLGLELTLDLATTIISFVALVQEGDCCGAPINFGEEITLGITIPYFLLILAELAVLGTSAHAQWCGGGPTQAERLARNGEDYQEKSLSLLKVLQWLFLLNPFFGCVVTFGLLYQSSRTEALIVFGLEGISLFLQWTAVYFEGSEITRCKIMIHALPIIPFLITIAVMVYYLENEGVCYRNGNLSFNGCELCEGGIPPSVGGSCPNNGAIIGDGDYCGAEKEFCWFPY